MKRKIIASALAMTLAASSAIVLSGCGENGKDQNSTTAPASTVAATTAKESKSSAEKNTQSNTASNSADSTQSSNSSGGQDNDLQSIALNAYGYSSSSGYYAVQTGATHNVEGTFDIVAVYDPSGDFVDNVYIHTSGYPVYAGKDVFESVHSDNSVARQEGNDVQSSASGQTGDNSNDGDYNRPESYNSQNSINQGGDGRDYADRGY